MVLNAELFRMISRLLIFQLLFHLLRVIFLLSSVTGFPVDSLDSVWGAFPPSAEQCWLHYFWLYGGNRHFVLAVFDNASHLQPFRYLDRLAHIELFRSSVMLLFFLFWHAEWFRMISTLLIFQLCFHLLRVIIWPLSVTVWWGRSFQIAAFHLVVICGPATIACLVYRCYLMANEIKVLVVITIRCLIAQPQVLRQLI